jgi:hypothetical protein
MGTGSLSERHGQARVLLLETPEVEISLVLGGRTT